MKRLGMLFITVLMFIVFTGLAAQAAELNGLIGAGAGTLTSVDYVAAGFNGYAGQQVIFTGLPLEYSDTIGFCGVSSYSSMGTILAYGDTAISRTMILPTDDFYVYLCLRSSGWSGNFAALVTDYNAVVGLTSAKSAEMSTRAASASSPEIVDRLRKSLIKISEQIGVR